MRQYRVVLRGGELRLAEILSGPRAGLLHRAQLHRAQLAGPAQSAYTCGWY